MRFYCRFWQNVTSVTITYEVTPSTTSWFSSLGREACVGATIGRLKQINKKIT